MKIRCFLALATACLGAISAAQIPVDRVKPNPPNADTVAEVLNRVMAGTYSGRKNEIYSGYVLLKLKTPPPTARTRNAARALPAIPGATYRSQVANTKWTVWAIDPKADPRKFAQQAKSSGLVANAQPLNKIYPLLGAPNDGDWNAVESGEPMIPLGDGIEFRRLWYLDDLYAMEAWSDWPNMWYTAANKPTDSPLIAIIDTGCDIDHPDFRNAGATGPDVSQGGQFELELSHRFSFGEIVEGEAPDDTLGHGTHVTGLALAAGNNGSLGGHGIVGLGYPCRGMLLRVFDDSGNGSDADAASAIFYAADNGADIINLSLGTENYSVIFQEAVTYAWQKGAIVVAAGNEASAGGGDLGPIYPAACSSAIAVTANGPDYAHASDYYAGTGDYIDVAAPGGNAIVDISDFENPVAMYQYMYSTTMRQDNPIMDLGAPGYDLNYGYLVGTSMATPTVSGSLGLLYGKFGLRSANGGDNLRASRDLQRSVYGFYGAPNGGWELEQGYGSVLVPNLLEEYDTRAATSGAIEGLVYLNGDAANGTAVRAKKIGGTVTYTTTTVNGGRYRFDQLPAGDFEVWAAPGGNERRKRTRVIAGCEMPGFNFWCGSYTGDDTPPVLHPNGSVEAMLSGSNALLTIHSWAYDTETGIDKLTVKVGTGPGSDDLLPETEVIVDSAVATVTAPAAALIGKRYVTLTYTNGGMLTTSASYRLTPLPALQAEAVSITAPSTVAAGTQFEVTVTMRNTGSKGWSQTGVPRIALSSINPYGNTRWRVNRVGLPVASVRSMETVAFTFTVLSPSTPGSYSFQWQMESGSTLFGTPTVNKTITVN